MVTWAWIVASVFVGLWLLTWVVQIAAWLMFAIAWAGWLALRVALGVLAVLFTGWAALFGPGELRRQARAAFAQVGPGGAVTRPA